MPPPHHPQPPPGVQAGVFRSEALPSRQFRNLDGISGGHGSLPVNAVVISVR